MNYITISLTTCILLLSLALGCGPATKASKDLESQTQREPKGPKVNQAGSFAWFLKHHKDKIAHYDQDRNITQIKVLNQIELGPKQCGYHQIRNTFYLSALALAIEKRDSRLINTLFNELHDAKKYKHFVKTLAAIKGCSTTRFHEVLPNKDELKKLFAEAGEGLPSSFTLEDILLYAPTVIGYGPGRDHDWPDRVPSFLDYIKKEFGFIIPTSDNLEKLLKLSNQDPELVLDAPARFKSKKPFAYALYTPSGLIGGTPGHGSAASAFRDGIDGSLNLLVADSWSDSSFKTGLPKLNIDGLYALLKDPEQTKNRFLIEAASTKFRKRDLLEPVPNPLAPPGSFGTHTENPDSLTQALQKATNDQEMKNKIIARLKSRKEEFHQRIKELGLEEAPLYSVILSLINKIDQKYAAILGDS